MKNNPSAPSKVSAIAPGAALTPQQARDAGVADQAQQQMSHNGTGANTQKPQQQADTGNNAGQETSTEPSPSKQQADGTPASNNGGR